MLFVALFVLVALAVAVAMSRRSRRRAVQQAADDTALSAQWVHRLAGQLDGAGPAPGRTTAAREAFRAASEFRVDAEKGLAAARTPTHATRTRESAVAGLHYVRAARIADGEDPGAPLPPPAGADTAGSVEAARTARWEGRDVTVSPAPGDGTPHYFPGGRVRGRPVPQGWYSEPWWSAAQTAAGWPPDAVGLFDALLTGLPGVHYDGVDFERGHGARPRPDDADRPA